MQTLFTGILHLPRKSLFEIAFFLVLILNVSCSQKETQNVGIEYLHTGSNIWQLEVFNDTLLATANYNGFVSLIDVQNGESVWSYPSGAFVFDLSAGDLNRNGVNEIAFVTAEGELIVLNEKGQKLWSFKSRLPLYNVGIGNVLGDDKLEVTCGGIDRFVYLFNSEGKEVWKSEEMSKLVHRISVGNLYGDDHDDILVIENRSTANLITASGDSVYSAWRKTLKVPGQMVNWENPRGDFFAFSVEIDDINNDGNNEIIIGDTFFNKQSVMVTDHQAEPIWISEGLSPFKTEDQAQLEFYSTAFVRCADILTEYPGKEVISVAGGMFRVWDQNGTLIGSQNSKLGFTDFEITDDKLYLGSCPNGDDYIYKLKLTENWQNDIASLEFKGLIKEIKENTKILKKQVEAYQPGELKDNRYNIIDGFGSISTTDEGLHDYLEHKEWFIERFPYENLRLVNSMKVIEHNPPLDETGKPWSPGRWKVDAINGTMSVDDILDKAEWIEKNKIPTLFYIGHSCMPFITLETAEKILLAAPNYCIGFQTFEDENIEMVPRYFEHFYEPLANLCLKYGNKLCITKNKGLWWMTSPAQPQVYQAMFKDGRDKVAMAATEDSNSRTPEINLMARGGLWQAGLLKNNDVSIHADLFSFNRFHQWEYPRAGHPYLRLLVAHTTLGMTQISSRIRDISHDEKSYDFLEIGKESTEIFYHMLGKGIVFSPDRVDILGYSPIGMVVHQPEEKWLTDAHNGHSPEKWVEDEELHKAIFPHNGSLRGMTNTPDHAFQKIIFNKERQYGYQLPPTPYGLVVFVPEFTDLDDVANVEEWWHTDGIYVWKEGGPKLTGQEAATVLKADFIKASEELPFRQIGDAVFMQVIRLAENHFRLVLVDPGWVNPADRDVVIKIQMMGVFSAENTLSKEDYSVDDKQFSVHVPAGLFSIVDVQRKSLK